MDKKAKYIDVMDKRTGRIVTHLIYEDEEENEKISKKKPLDAKKIKYSTKNVNGKVITTVIYEQ